MICQFLPSWFQNYLTVLDDINNSSPACAALKEPDTVLSTSVIPRVLEEFKREPLDIADDEGTSQQGSPQPNSRPLSEEDVRADSTELEEKSSRYVMQLVGHHSDLVTSPIHSTPDPSLKE